MKIPIPQFEEAIYEVVTVDRRDDERVRRYLDVPNWKCPRCGTIVFGRTPTCAYCKQRLNTVTYKPGS